MREDKVLQDLLNFKYGIILFIKLKYEKNIPDPACCIRYYGR